MNVETREGSLRDWRLDGGFMSLGRPSTGKGVKWHILQLPFDSHSWFHLDGSRATPSFRWFDCVEEYSNSVCDEK